MDPRVAASEDNQTFVLLIVVRNPLNVNMISDGIGGNMFSSRIRNAIPKYP
jgi:hypothetical protein